MKLAFWDFLPESLLNTPEPLVSGLEIETVSAPPAECVNLLKNGLVDVALVPSLTALRDPKGFELVPGVGLMSWKWPYAQILTTKFDQIKTVGINPIHAQETVLTSIILKEHYNSFPKYNPVNSFDENDLLGGNEAALVVNTAEQQNSPREQKEGVLSLDLGQEWYEYTGLPMVWGCFVVRPGDWEPNQVDILIKWIQYMSDHFSSDNINLKESSLVLGNEGEAGLTSLGETLFLHGALTEMPEPNWSALPDFEEESNDEEENYDGAIRPW